MSDLNKPEPPPTAGEGAECWPLVIASSPWSDATKADMLARDALGRERYGTPLHVWNGRDAAIDAYQECLDLRVYLMQVQARLVLAGSRAHPGTVDALSRVGTLTGTVGAAVEWLGALARSGVVPKEKP